MIFNNGCFTLMQDSFCSQFMHYYMGFPMLGPCIEHDSKKIIIFVEENYLSAHFLVIMNDIYTKLCL